MDKCKYESEVKRLKNLLDGNGERGIKIQISEINGKIKDMEHSMMQLSENDKEIMTSVSAFSKYINTSEILDAERQRVRKQEEKMSYERIKERKAMVKFAIAQLLVVVSLVVTIILTNG